MRRVHAGLETAAVRLWRRAQEDRWSLLFGQIAVYSFVVVLVTGMYLTFFFHPGMSRVAYQGSYPQLRGVAVSKAYASTLHISFDARGGLLMRQVHHWAALVMIAAVCCQLVRLFMTGGHRRPRGMNWLIWVTVLVLAMAAGVTGTVLPDDMLSGGSLSLIQGILQSIPVIGTRLAFWVFGGAFPGHDVIARAYWVHVTVLPVTVAALLMVRRRLAGKHLPRPVPMAASVAMFGFTCAVLALLGTFAQINPVWLVGPFEPGNITSGAVPGWYMGFLDGAVRIMPGWEIDLGGHPLTLAVLVPALIVPGAFFTLVAAAPWLERRFTGDNGLHHVLDRPRDAAIRTGVCAAGITFYGSLWAAAANDRIAVVCDLSLYAVTWFFRIAVFAGPAMAFFLTRRICLGLVHRERDEAGRGYETGRVVMSPAGGFSEIRRPVREPGALSPAGRARTPIRR